MMFQASLPAMGVETWAEKTIMHRYQLKVKSVCCCCKKSGAVWVDFESKEYCASCWNTFFMGVQAKAKDDEMAMEEKAGELAEDN
jgi:hypothetical protein